MIKSAIIRLMDAMRNYIDAAIENALDEHEAYWHNGGNGYVNSEKKVNDSLQNIEEAKKTLYAKERDD